MPPAVLLKMLQIGRTNTNIGRRWRMAGPALTALTFAHPDGGAIPFQDAFFIHASTVIEIASYKLGARANHEPLVIHIPRRAAHTSDSANDLVHDHVAAVDLAKATPDQDLFTLLRDLTPLPTDVATAWTREGLYLLNAHAPAGVLYSGHSLRAGATANARCVGCSLDAIPSLMGMRDKSNTTVSAIYIYALAEPDAAA